VNVKTEVVSVQLLIEEIILSLNNIAHSENVTVNYDFKIPVNFKTVKGYLHSIFYNLVINSVKYKRHGVDPVISVTATKVAGKLEIQFQDNGKGISEKDLKSVFGLYKRFDTSVEGKGMGLFMVKVQVENLGGTIGVESTLGDGTTFKLMLPESR
jgi:signal transduction histidine kinase